MKKYLLLVIVLMLAALCAACAGEVRHEVRFEPNGGEGMAFTQTVKDGEPVSEPEDPVREGYGFRGWFTDEACTGDPYAFTEPVYADLTLYAGWEPREAETPVGTAEEFLQMREGRYRLIADLDFTGIAYTPLGTEEAPFTGRLDGAGHVLRGVKVSGALAGVFGCLAGSVKNLRVEDAVIEVTAPCGTVQAGILAGRIWGGTAEGCHVSGTVSLTGADARLSVYAGAIAGRSTDGRVSGCSAEGTVSAANTAAAYAGGLVGYNGGEGGVLSRVENSRFLGSVSATAAGEKASAYAGGAVGYNAGMVCGCYAAEGSARAKTGEYVCYAGGLVGDNNGGQIANSFSCLDAATETAGGSSFLGGVTGHNFLEYTFENSYCWNGQRLSHVGGAGQHRRLQAPSLTAAELASASRQAGILGEGFAYREGYYPTPAGAKEAAVSLTAPQGTEADPILINDARGLAEMESGKAYRLQRDLTVQDWAAVGSYTAPFYGSLDGDGHTVTVTGFASEGNYRALFGYFCGRVTRLRVAATADMVGGDPLFAAGIVAYNAGGYIARCEAEVHLTATAASVHCGAVTGYNDGGTLSECSAAGEISVTASTPSAVAGGIAAGNYGLLVRAESSVTVTLHGGKLCYAGGIAGKNGGTVADCRSLGSIQAALPLDAGSRIIAGGVIGENRGMLRDCYSASRIATDGGDVVAAGGVAGANYATVKNCYFLRDGDRFGVAFSEKATEAVRCEQEDLRTLAEKLGGAWRNDASSGMPVLQWREDKQ